MYEDEQVSGATLSKLTAMARNSVDLAKARFAGATEQQKKIIDEEMNWYLEQVYKAEV